MSGIFEVKPDQPKAQAHEAKHLCGLDKVQLLWLMRPSLTWKLQRIGRQAR